MRTIIGVRRHSISVPKRPLPYIISCPGPLIMLRFHFTGLWRHANFVRLWIGQTISVFGSLIGATAMAFTAILVLDATPFQLGLLSAARLIPGFLTGLAAGAWVDRLRRRPILIGADIGRAVLLATIPFAAVLGLLRIEHLYVVAFLVSILTIFFDVAYQSYLPSLIGRAELVEGNSKLSASNSVAEVSGFGVAGWLVQIFTAPMTMLIDAVSFVVSAVAVWMIDQPEEAASRESRADMRREIAEGLREVWRHPLLRATTACAFSREFFVGIYGTLVLLYMARDLGFAPGVLGTIFAVGGISSLMGAVATGSLTRRFGVGPSMILGLTLSGIALFLIPLAQGATLTAALLLILQQLAGDGALTIYQINQVSLRQTITPERLLGRVSASAEFLGLGATLAGSILGGVLGEMIGVRATLFLGALGALLSTLWLLLSPVRGLRTVAIPLVEFESTSD
ncbi:MAG: MFS transporter [Blastocatellia bacterium]